MNTRENRIVDMADEAIDPIEQHDVDYEGHTLVSTLIDQGNGPEIYIPLRPIVEYMGLAWGSQANRVRRDPILSESSLTIKVVRPRGGEQGGTVTQSMLSLPLKFLNGYLFGVDHSRVREDLQETIIEFKRRCYDILSAPFSSSPQLGSRAVRVLPSNVMHLVQIRDISLAVANMAQEMIEQAERIETVETRLDAAARYVAGIEKRLGVVEERTAPRNVISEDQADIIRAKVLALADMMAERDPDPTKQQYYQGVYRTLYTHFDVGSYKRIRNQDYEAVLEFLEGWRNRILSDD